MATGGYWCCIITRDGGETIGRTLASITDQSFPPQFVIVVDDGSTDETPRVIAGMASTFDRLYVIRTSSKTRDIRRVPVLLNLGILGARTLSNGSLPQFMMVSGDDNLLTKEYARSLIRRMENDRKLAVASGSWLGEAGRANQMPHGAGRLVRSDFMESVGGLYPVAYGWEVWVLYKALQMGLRVKNFSDLRYDHLRPYNPRNLLGWGRAMYSLGFPTLFVLLRFGLNFVWTGRGTQSRRSTVRMAAGYLAAKFNPESLSPNLINDEGLKEFVKRYSTRRIVRLAL